MANEVTKCPMCGTKLKMINGRMTCKECGYYIRGSEGQDSFSGAAQQTSTGGSPYPQSSAGTAGSTGSQYQTTSRSAPTRQTGTMGQTSTSWRNGPSVSSAPKQPAEHNPTVAIVVSIVTGVICLILFAVIVLAKSGALTHMLPERESAESVASASSSQPRKASDQASEESGQTTRGDVSSYYRLPQSDFFCSVAEYIWDKPCDTITDEEFANLTAIQIDRDEKSITYQLGYGDTLSASYESDEGMELSDLSCFTGLEWVSIDASFEKGDLKGLENLYGLYSENSLDEIADIVPYPEYITDLGVADTFLASSLNGLEDFPNLMYLKVDYAGLTDISALTQSPDLLGLNLSGCDRLTDFSPLMSMINLEELTIESDQLKSIDFIKNMPALNSLSIESTQVSNVDALAECPQLEYLYLYLDGSYSITDYSVIGNLTLLNKLALEMSGNYNGIMPSFENLTNLQYLSLKGARDVAPIKDAVNLTYLSLEDCSGDSLDVIASLQEIQSLYINDFSSYTSSLEPLTHLPNLMMLDLEDTSVFGNIEEIFGIPTLRYLYLDDCQVGMDFASLPSNETLEVLSLNDISILYDPTYNNGDKVKLSDHYDMFDCFPNLTELYIESTEIDSIEFVAKLPKLQYLDITDNNVTSLKPLESLSDFQAVWCGQNTILETLPESSGITVYTTEY